MAIASGLVTTADLDAAEATALGEPAADPSTREADRSRRTEAAAAAVLVEQGKLTPFQAREMLAGRTRFRLGQYTVIDEIGRGGMGQVFEAEHALMGRRVAVKVLPRAKATPESEAAFRREMRILGRLDHENLVRAFDAGYDAMVYYLVTELVPGIDLRRQVRTFGTLDEVTAASLFSQVARALAFAHAHQLVHRDVKPGNILVMDDGRAKLLDLGLAGSTLEAEALRLGRVVGTMDYIAPEQIRTPDDVGPAADIYALGCSLYFALCGTVPFPGGTRKDKMRRHLTETPAPIRRLSPHLPESLCRVVEAMMAKSVADRIGSAEEVIRQLARWTPDHPAPVPRRARGELPVVRPAGEVAEESSARSWGPAWPVVDDAASAAGAVRSRHREAASADDGFWSLLGETVHAIASWRPARVTLRVFGPAVLAGAGITISLSLVRWIAPWSARLPLGNVAPTTWGVVAFVLMAGARAVAPKSRRRR